MAEVLRYLPVRSRATRALVDRLKTITHNNGYSTQFNHIHINNSLVERPIDPPEIFLLFGRSKLSDHSNLDYREKADVEIWFIVPALTPEVNEEYDIAVYDIIRCIDPCGTAIVEEDGSEIWCELSGHQPFYQGSNQEKFIWGKVDIELQYFWTRGEPNTYNVADIKVLKED